MFYTEKGNREGKKRLNKRKDFGKMQGKVKMFQPEKGYGFIVTEEGKEIFFHYSQLLMEGYKTIAPDTAVEFELIETQRGLQANNIVKL